MRSMQHTNLALLTVAFLSVITASTGLQAQDPRLAALDSLRAMSLDSVPGVATAYFRPADRDRALELRSMLEEYLDFWNAQLGLQLQLRLAVLSPDDWQKITPQPYAFPNFVSPPANLIPAPAAPPPPAAIDSLLIERERGRDWLLIGHEGGHLLTLALLPPDVLALLTDGSPGDSAFRSRVRWINGIPSWFWEYSANYFATAFLQTRHPDDAAVWVRYLETLSAPPPPRFSHLDEFPELTTARAADGTPYLHSPEGLPNFGWYQGVVGLLGVHVLAEGGDAVGQVRRVLSSDNIPTTAELLAELEAIAPGARTLLDSLGAGYRSRGEGPDGAELRSSGTSLQARAAAVAIRGATVIDVTNASSPTASPASVNRGARASSPTPRSRRSRHAGWRGRHGRWWPGRSSTDRRRSGRAPSSP